MSGSVWEVLGLMSVDPLEHLKRRVVAPPRLTRASRNVFPAELWRFIMWTASVKPPVWLLLFMTESQYWKCSAVHENKSFLSGLKAGEIDGR